MSTPPFKVTDVTQGVQAMGLAIAHWMVRRQMVAPSTWPFQILCRQDKGANDHPMPPLGWTVPQPYQTAGTRFATARARWAPSPGTGSVVKVPPNADLGNEVLFHGADTLVADAELVLATAPAPVPEAQPAALTGRPVLGVIDGPSDYDHPQWVDRVQTVWHMEDEPALQAPWQPNTDFSYGYTLRPVQGAAKPEYGLPIDHANAVIALGAGAVDPADPESEPASLPGLIIVHLPCKALTETHGLWLNVYVLDAVRFILDKAPPDAPVVINLSVGAYGGAHDGSSLLEQALDELIQQERGRLCIVMAAGNTQQMHLHAQASLKKGQTPTVHRLELPGGMQRTAVLEAYLSGRAKVELVAEDWPMDPVPLEPGQAVEWRHVTSDRCVGLASMSQVAQGYRLLVLWGGREAADGRQDASWCAPEGRWALRWTAEEDVQVDAFLWRHDDVAGAAEQQIEFLPDHPEIVATSLMAGSCYGLGPIVVGALEVAEQNAELAEYSPGGPGLGEPARQGPDLCTQGQVDLPETGLTLRGTSMAAPIVARRIAELYAVEGRRLSKAVLLDLLKKKGPLFDQGQDADPSRAGNFWLNPRRGGG